ncbi:UNVERIFIED_CONTAM: hypothetical protein FKN15_061067 [Acipenser sinensis]
MRKKPGRTYSTPQPWVCSCIDSATKTATSCHKYRTLLVTMEKVTPQNIKKKETRTRGHKWRLDKGAFRTETRRHFFTQRIVGVWNQLPSNVVEADTLGSFKKLLNEILGSISY